MIKSITIVTAQGVDITSVGQDGATLIKEEAKQISSDEIITVYRVYQGDYLLREISAACPLDIKFER